MKRQDVKKAMKVFAATMLCTGAFALTSFAGSWVNDAHGWWYNYGNGNGPSSSWQWIDGNNDGIAECYYFDRMGYCMMNATTPDGYQVNGSGAWVENGVVQTRNMGSGQAGNGAQNTSQSSSQNNDQSGEKSSKQGGLTLFNANSLLNHYVDREDSLVSNRENKSYTKCFEFWPGEYIEFDNSAGYTHLKATVFPAKGYWGEGDRVLLQVLSGEDEEFYVTQDIYYDTKAFDIDVDISGYEKVRIKVISVNNGAYVGLANARFE